ncbi:MAG: hypothetical protein U1F07_05745 [Rubrivivax sp.]
MKPLARAAVWLAAAAVLALVALAYLSPHRMVELAARLWACF